MNKAQKLWKKQEKRIVKLLYRKGLIDELLEHNGFNNLCCEHHHLIKTRSRRKNKYRTLLFCPEILHISYDYYGEADSRSLVDIVTTGLYFENVIEDKKYELQNNGWPKSTFKYKGRQWFINYLSELPTKRHDSKINKVLKFEKE
jgi:hypothetical protein